MDIKVLLRKQARVTGLSLPQGSIVGIHTNTGIHMGQEEKLRHFGVMVTVPDSYSPVIWRLQSMNYGDGTFDDTVAGGYPATGKRRFSVNVTSLMAWCSSAGHAVNWTGQLDETRREQYLEGITIPTSVFLACCWDNDRNRRITGLT